MVPDITDHKHKISNRLENNSFIENMECSTNFFDMTSLFKDRTKNNDGTDNEWIKIEKPSLIELILETYFDSDKKKILKAASNKPIIIPKILDVCKISPTPGYRKINSLIQTGLIVPAGFIVIQKRKKVKKYKSIFENVKIFIDKDNMSVKVKLKKCRKKI